MNILATVDLPAIGWQPRPHQKKLWRYLMTGGKRAVAVWHRRAGKDEVLLHTAAIAMFERPANYVHLLPEYSHGRRAIWDSVNPHTGRKRIDEAFPHEMRKSTRDHDMRIEFFNNSTWSVGGADRYDTTMGSSVAGIVFSEYALANPSSWGYYRPILEENNGWACWISTPRGRNHLLQLYEHAQRTDGWFAERLTIDDTKALSHEAVAETLKEYISLYGEDQGQAMFDQELMCSWNAQTLGAYYAMECALVRAEGRITELAEPVLDRAVHTCWDLGVTDDTSIWMYQAQPSGQLVVCDHFASSGVGVEWYRDELFKRYAERGWIHGNDYVPHDAKIKEWGSGRTRVETMRALGLNPLLVPMATVEDGINAVRRALPLCVFHPRTEDGGFSALESYRREWDDEKKAFKASAVHDWSSHPADAFRYLAMSYKQPTLRVVKPPPSQGWQIPPPAEAKHGGIRF